MLIQARRSPEAGALVRFGLTASKKAGGAVVRNRARRRLREIARKLLPAIGRSGVDYVLIANPRTAAAPWAALLDEAQAALQRLARALDRQELDPDAVSRPSRSPPKKADDPGQ
jgi:ribonuclease P protein component